MGHSAWTQINSLTPHNLLKASYTVEDEKSMAFSMTKIPLGKLGAAVLGKSAETTFPIDESVRRDMKELATLEGCRPQKGAKSSNKASKSV